MRIPGIAIILAIIMTTPGAGQAQARKIFIPIQASSGKLVKAGDPADIHALRRKDGRHVDPGYKSGRSSGGEWAGHAGGLKRRLPVSEEEWRVLMAKSGMKKQPPASGKPGGSSGVGEILFSSFLTFAVLFLMLYRLVSHVLAPFRLLARLFVRRAKKRQEDAEVNSMDEAAMLRVQMRMEEMARQRQAVQHARHAHQQPGCAPFPQAEPAASRGGAPSDRYDSSGRTYGLGAQPAPARQSPAFTFGEAASRPVFGQRRT